MILRTHRSAGALARLAVCLLCAAALLKGTAAQAQAQGFKSLPEASQLIGTAEPSPQQLFCVQSEATLRAHMIEQARQRKQQPPLFPPDAPLESILIPRAWPHQTVFAEASYVCYGRLLFQQLNAERYGWDLGPFQWLTSFGLFFVDVAALPYNIARAPCECDCSSGYCLPGSNVPLLLYTPDLSLTGTLAEAATIGLLFVAFP
jgi:hypothetical protein